MVTSLSFVSLVETTLYNLLPWTSVWGPPPCRAASISHRMCWSGLAPWSSEPLCGPHSYPQASAARSYTSLHLLLSIKPQQLGTEGLRLCTLYILIRGHCEWCYFPGCLCWDSIKTSHYRHQALPLVYAGTKETGFQTELLAPLELQAFFLVTHGLRWCTLEGVMDFCIQENLDLLPSKLYGERAIKIKILLVAMSAVID